MHKSQARFVAVIALSLIAANGPVTSAQDDVAISAEIRYRGELSEKSFNLDNRADEAHLLRSRLQLQFHRDERVNGMLTLQDSRTFGYDYYRRGPDDILDVHEAFLEIRRVLGESIDLRIGRMELNFGNQRLVGGVNWSNSGQAFDALSVVKRWVGGSAQILYSLPEEYDGDGSATMLNLRFGDGIELLALLELYPNFDSDRLVERLTMAAYGARSIASGFDFIANAATQLGEIDVYVPVLGVRRDNVSIRAWLLTMELGWSPDSDGRARTALGVDLASGDDPHTEVWSAFDNLYYTGHEFRGAMDLFVYPSAAGLFDFYGSQSLAAGRAITTGFAVHYFRAHQPHADRLTETKSRGVEIDARLRATHIENATIELGGAIFFPSEDWRGPDADPALWGYTMITVRLP